MSGRAPYKPLIKKAVAACVAAIETYNKPASQHREETFAILIVSAWEALLKTRLIRDGGVRAIHVLEPVKTKGGRPRKRLRPKLNRCKNPFTISLELALNRCVALPSMPLDVACVANLNSLVEVRDNAVHYVNADRELARRVHEAGSASLRNFASALEEWFGISLGDQRFAILPVSFEPPATAKLLLPTKRSRQAANLLAFLDATYDEALPGMADTWLL